MRKCRGIGPELTVLPTILLSLLCLAAVTLGSVTPAYADIHAYHEQPGQTTLRSRQSLRDQNDLAWQITLFKRYRPGEEAAFYLRMVGFPALVSIALEADLQIQTGTLTHWQASPALSRQTKELPDNVAQYRVDQLMADLQHPIPLNLVVPLKSSLPAQLVVPPFVVREWLELKNMDPALMSKAD